MQSDEYAKFTSLYVAAVSRDRRAGPVSVAMLVDSMRAVIVRWAAAVADS